MKIDVFFDVYPHPAKPYFEAQLTEWQRQGHHLRLFSCGQIPGATSAFPISFIHTLRERPVSLLTRILWRGLTQPARTWRIVRCSCSPIEIIKLLATDAQLPNQEPDIHFVHNLATAVRFSYLRHATPHAKLAIYYHGGEIPGVRQIPLTESAVALGRAHVVFSNTPASVAEAASRGAPADRTVPIPVGFPLERFAVPGYRAYIPNSRWRFVCVGRMAQEKGFDFAMNVLADLRKRNPAFTVTFIGCGPMLHNMKELAARLKMEDIVQFIGHVDSHKLIPMFADFDALLLTSLPVANSNWTETQATVMQEAMLMRTIVIASDFGGIRESLPQALHQFLYTPGSAPELLKSLMSLMNYELEDLRQLSEAGRRFVLSNYNIRTISQQLLAHAVGDTSSPQIG